MMIWDSVSSTKRFSLFVSVHDYLTPTIPFSVCTSKTSMGLRRNLAQHTTTGMEAFDIRGPVHRRSLSWNL